ncbi:DNA-binding HxlR family transcriptional regulator [Crossiella equi]|uniref:DNA-binding HxlR family transcriptional regulator n=1 Tax=Crossiella equi TaxID=130796 RepID=A0ABS5A657_9PSEU|nr:helix-turn-helix domain-containing protein [Crossiella equi]MBP2472081.1 DNA-binding HxlR family transcriptional regulator [Crossiella equi]
MSERSYQDGCGAAVALDQVGERWALLVVRELVFGPKRFRDLKAGLPHASQNVLSHRLRELEAAGVVRRVELGPPASSQGYELTALGRRLEPALLELARWGALLPQTKLGLGMGTDSFLLLLKALYRPRALSTSVRLHIGADSALVSLTPEAITVARGAAGPAEAELRAEVTTLWRLLFTGLTLDAAVAAGDLGLEGDRAAAEAFLTLFPAPAS